MKAITQVRAIYLRLMRAQNIARCIFIDVISDLIMHQPSESWVNWRFCKSTSTSFIFPSTEQKRFDNRRHAALDSHEFALSRKSSRVIAKKRTNCIRKTHRLRPM